MAMLIQPVTKAAVQQNYCFSKVEVLFNTQRMLLNKSNSITTLSFEQIIYNCLLESFSN
jgi:hypothetical protein